MAGRGRGRGSVINAVIKTCNQANESETKAPPPPTTRRTTANGDGEVTAKLNQAKNLQFPFNNTQQLSARGSTHRKREREGERQRQRERSRCRSDSGSCCQCCCTAAAGGMAKREVAAKVVCPSSPHSSLPQSSSLYLPPSLSAVPHSMEYQSSETPMRLKMRNNRHSLRQT